MTYMNVGAYVDGVRPKTKKALREALQANPESVTFDGTSPFGPQHADLTGTHIPADLALSVVGPEPATTRNWYATVRWDARTGKATIT
jgi:hypothetical protein